jgi:hypothetical protein
MKAFYLIAFILSTAVQADNCYFANGTALPENYNGVVPCLNGPVRTICCALNRTNPFGGDFSDGETRDVCLDNGLCMNSHITEGKNETSYWLNFCTNSDITSPDCLDVCRETRNSQGGTEMTPCDGSPLGKRWCCGKSTTCCTNNVGVIELPERFVRSSSISSSSSSSTSSPSSSATTPAQSNSSSPPPPSSQPTGLSSGAKAGIAIGVILGVLSLVGVLFFARKARARKAKGVTDDASSDIYYQQQHYPSKFAHEAPAAQVNEIGDTRRDRSELPAVSPPVELSSDTQRQ